LTLFFQFEKPRVIALKEFASDKIGCSKTESACSVTPSGGFMHGGNNLKVKSALKFFSDEEIKWQEIMKRRKRY
jgi:hypothetical protein